MLYLRSFIYSLFKLPLKLITRCEVIQADINSDSVTRSKQPVFYIIRTQSMSDFLTLRIACKKQNLPDPLEQVDVNGKKFSRILYLEKPSPVFGKGTPNKTNVLKQGQALLELHKSDENLDVQLIPVNINWGRKPTKEKNEHSVGAVFSDQQSPSWLRKFFIVLFFGRHTLVRFSNAFTFRSFVDDFGADEKTARKLLRVTRFHFYRQTIAASGPRLMHRQQMFNALMANPAIKKLLNDEVNNRGQNRDKVEKQALKIMDEIAGDYRDGMVRIGDRVLTWLWNRLYNGLEVSKGERIRELAEEGHEIIYVPCHRSHMDYLLLTHVIYHQGLVIPRIAAGINLNFWPAGPIFRKAGAFFIRRSFRGDRLYSVIFREYLGLLFERGYSVKYYTEGGRSRTGRLLAPKTGMLAMTIQSMLRGVERPLTLVPVYLGYDHVMEVSTYHKELSGSKKKNESIFGVIKAIKNLRNYGKGFVNFGEPININQFLNTQVPDWKSAIDPIEPQKPSWLTPSVNLLGNEVMVNINKAVALSGVSLVALILHASENKALAKQALIDALDFFLLIQKQAPYSSEVTLPEATGEQLVAHVIQLKKVTVSEDDLGVVISLDEKAALEMSYYRNNILHAYLLPAFVFRFLECNNKLTHDELTKNVEQLIMLVKAEFFLWQSTQDIQQQVTDTLKVIENLGLAKQTKAGYWSLTETPQLLSKLRLMSECGEATIQRLVMVTQLISQLAPTAKATLESNMVTIAKRLALLNNIHSPEIIDKKAQSDLINKMKMLGYITSNEKNELLVNDKLNELKDMLRPLVDIKVLQTIMNT